MSEGYRLYRPKTYRRRIPIFWWLRRLSYTHFITRELTSLAVVYAACLLLAQVWALSRGADAYHRFVDLLGQPIALAFHGLVVAALLFHTITWLHLAPRAMVVRLAGRRIPDSAVLAAHYLAWIGASAILLWGLSAA